MGTYVTSSKHSQTNGYGHEADCGLEPTASDHSDRVLYVIKKDPVVGRYMVAGRDILPGEVIFMDQPAVVGPDNSSKPLCLGCFRRVSGLFLCRGCNWPMCRESCSKSPFHVQECNLFKSRGAKISVPWFDRPCTYYDAILPLRVLLLKIHNPKVYKLVTLLMDHNDCLDEGTHRRRQTLVDFMRKTCRLANDFSDEEIHRILGILSVNSFVVHDGGSDETNTDLIALYPWTSLMSHNCIANTKITTREDFSYVCEATQRIKAGDEIVTNYHHYHYQFYGTSYRRQDLKGTWSFDCCCPRCADKTESGTHVSAVVCENCKFGYTLPVNPLDYNSVWSCDKCHTTFPGADIDAKVKKFETEIDDVTAGNAEEFEKLLRRMRYFLHENHYWILDVKRKLIDIYGNKPGFELYKIPKEILERKSDYCDHLLSIATKLCPGPSEMRGYLLWERHGVRLRLAQWEWIRMKIGTPTYLERLRGVLDDLREIIEILGPIRLNSDEGQMGLKAKQEFREVEKLITDLSKQSLSTSTLTMSKNSSPPMSGLANRDYNHLRHASIASSLTSRGSTASTTTTTRGSVDADDVIAYRRKSISTH